MTPASAATPRSSGLSSCGCSAPVSPPVCVKRPLLPAYVLAAVVGYSRLVIHAHSVSEVIAGLLLGAAGSALFWCCKNVPLIRKA
ncbi:phosphatase PAP2 family protein [Klebsiella pneumoniae]|uniref:Phosphatase PAP2 family protein n=1 Tax=Klebsiella pneumoniae TaxID=573 RepID=A0A927HSF9_KLEPN|nr:phosphatase PAP2 family protein [Klebsiella pneumoniae]